MKKINQKPVIISILLLIIVSIVISGCTGPKETNIPEMIPTISPEGTTVPRIEVLPSLESYQFWKAIDNRCSTNRAFANANFGLCEQARMNLALIVYEAENRHPVLEIAPGICPSGNVHIPNVPGWCIRPS